MALTNLITEEVPITVRQMLAISAITYISGHISNVRKTDGKFFAIILAVFATFPKLSFPHNVDKILSSLPFSLLVHFWT